MTDEIAITARKLVGASEAEIAAALRAERRKAFLEAEDVLLNMMLAADSRAEHAKDLMGAGRLGW